MADNDSIAGADWNSDRSVRSGERVFHTVTACVRCRQRKTRCDPSLPRCEPCERVNAHCEYFDSARHTTIPRNYITVLQDTVRKLQDELTTLETADEQNVDPESMAKAAALVRFNEKDESRFLGPSSGINVTRFVMEFAKQNTARKTIRDVVPDQQAQEIKQKFDAESAKPTSKIYPLISSVAAPNLPNRDLMEKLVELYMVKAQYMLPLLHEPTFRQEVNLVYQGSQDATQNFQVRMVIAISMQKLDKQYAGLADSYYLAALPHLETATKRRDISTLQCFALIAQYSLLTPTRTAAYWVVGLAAKLCYELGLCDEQTIAKPPSGAVPNFLEIDMRRRLFWIITSMEYGLAHSLGRPSAFGVSTDNINVKFFELCDDQYITPEGLLPGHYAIMKKCISIHFLKMRLLQADIRRTLYLKKRPSPQDDTDPWFSLMLNKIDDWVINCPKNDEGSGLSETWFQGRRNTMVIFMYRPSPQISTPSVNAAIRCYEAAVFNIYMHKRQVEESLVDITWIFTQALFMALNTMLWTLSYPQLRQIHTLEEVQGHVQNALKAIDLCADRWPGVISAQQLYGNLVQGCLRAYDNDKSVNSPGSVSIPDYSSATSQGPLTPSSPTAGSIFGPNSPPSAGQSHSGVSSHGYVETPARVAELRSGNLHGPYGSRTPLMETSSNGSYTTGSPPAVNHQTPVGSPSFPAQGGQFPFPPVTLSLPAWDNVTSAPTFDPGQFAYPNMSMDDQPWLASFGDVYSGGMGQFSGQMPYQIESLNESDQLDLLASLEKTNLPAIPAIGGMSTTFYDPHLP